MDSSKSATPNRLTRRWNQNTLGIKPAKTKRGRRIRFFAMLSTAIIFVLVEAFAQFSKRPARPVCSSVTTLRWCTTTPTGLYRMTIDEVKAWIFQYVFGYYNRIRVTTVNPGGWPPSVYREMYMHTVAAA